jgi:YD repeat-containing protein
MYFLLGSGWTLCTAQVLGSTASLRSPLTKNVTAADPFDVQTGIYIRQYHDLFIQDTVPIDLVRTQRNMDTRSRAFGVGSSTSYDMFIVGDVTKFSWVSLVMADGSQEVYTRISPGTGYADGLFEDKTTPDEFYGSRISWNHRGGWTVKMRDGSEFTIRGCDADSKPGQCAVTEQKNAQGERLVIDRDREGNIKRVISPHGRSVAFAVDSAGRITRAQDDTGWRWINYRYDVRGRLVETWSSRGEKQEFGYDERSNMTSVRETGVATYRAEAYDFSLVNYDDERDRLAFQKTSTGQQWSVDYSTRASDRVQVNSVTAPDGKVRYFFNPSGYEFREEYFHGSRAEWVLELPRDPQDNSVLNMALTCQAGKIHFDLPATTDIKNGESRRELLSKLCGHAEKPNTLRAGRSLPK